jgi:hypothetical protein
MAIFPFGFKDVTEQLKYGFTDEEGQVGWHGISDLNVLLSPIALKKIIVRKRLKPGGFPHCETSALKRIRVNEVVAILGDVRGNRCRRLLPNLYPESILEVSGIPVLVRGREAFWKFPGFWRSSPGFSERAREEISR